MLSNKGVDIVARWEFDFVLRDLMLAVEKGNKLSEVKGISYKNGIITHNPDRELSSSEELDTLPFVSQVYQKHLNVKDYMLTYSHSMHPEVQIFTGRGCPFRCTFCSSASDIDGEETPRTYY